MSSSQLRIWSHLHRWTSLLSTGFLLMLCITGLPLIFHEEIDTALGNRAPIMGPASSGSDVRLRPLDAFVTKATANHGGVPVFMAFDNGSPLLTVTTAPTPDAPASAMTLHSFDRASGTTVAVERDDGVMHALLELHANLFLGLPGALLLGGMGLVFVIALISGVVLYRPFMRDMRFGTVRASRSAPTRWLDLHNLIGIAAFAWMAVVGVTGVINALSGPLVQLWQARELAQMTTAYRGQPPLAPDHYASLDRVMTEARSALPGLKPQFIAFPGGSYSSPHHYAVFFQGATPLTERLLTVVLIDAEDATITASAPMPWYWQALAVSQPLHFGDYGGLPMKLLWAILTLLTIIVLASGLYLWFVKQQRQPLNATAVAR